MKVEQGTLEAAIDKLLEEMAWAFELVHRKLAQRPKRQTANKLIEARKWLLDIHDGPFENFRKLYTSQCPEHWQQLELHGLDGNDLPEVRNLSVLKRALTASLKRGISRVFILETIKQNGEKDE